MITIVIILVRVIIMITIVIVILRVSGTYQCVLAIFYPPPK